MKRLSKYRAKPTTIDNVRFASQREARMYTCLKMLALGGQIADLKLQPKIPLKIDGVLICTYIADFLYFDRKIKKMVWLDVKSEFTRKLPVYRLKKKLVKALTGIEITEA